MYQDINMSIGLAIPRIVGVIELQILFVLGMGKHWTFKHKMSTEDVFGYKCNGLCLKIETSNIDKDKLILIFWHFWASFFFFIGASKFHQRSKTLGKGGLGLRGEESMWVFLMVFTKVL